MSYKHFPLRFSGRSASDGFPVIIGAAQSPGRTASGVMPSSRLDGGGMWSATFQNIYVRTPTDVRLWESVRAYLADGARPIVVPFCLKRFMPAPVIDGETVYGYDPIPHDDETYFSDGSGYYQPAVVATLAESADLRTTTLVVDLTSGSGVKGLFSIRHDTLWHRLYRIVTSALDDDTGLYTITIEPPLREATNEGAELDFDYPKCVMQLSGAGGMSMQPELLRFGRGSASFIESFLDEPS